MTRGKHIPIRTCIGCGAKKAKEELIRIVRSPDGKVYLDLSGKESGRGAYICPDLDCLKRALRKKALQRSLKVEKVEESLLKEVENYLSEKRR
ncbi:MAG: YlxR family protein [Synergistetes bacterium]|nr:YlxR family protein [Synergistota bacterium]